MMKFFRNTSLFIITLMLAFGFYMDVDAAATECETKYGLTNSNECRVTENRTIVVSGNGAKYRPLRYSTETKKSAVGTHGRTNSLGYPTNFYRDISIDYYVNSKLIRNGYFTSYKDTNYPSVVMFCLDAQHEGYNPLWASRFLLDTSESGGVKAFDVAVMEILVGDGNLPSVVTESNVTDYWARLTAIRAVEYTFGYYYVGDSTEHLGAFHANLSVINSWLNEDSSHYDALNEAMGGSLASRSSFQVNTTSYFSGAATSLAKEYYFNALDAATEYIYNAEDNRAKVDTTTVKPEPGEVEVDERPEGDFVSKDVVHTIIVSGMPNNGQNSFKINGIKYVDDVEYAGLEGYISSIQIGDVKIEGRNLVESFLEQDLLAEGSAYDFTEETEIKITVHFEGYETANNDRIETLKCGQAPIKYYIDGSYTSSEFGKYSDYVATIWYNDHDESQRYLSIEKAGENSNEATWKSEYETYLIDACDCDDLIEACIASGNINSSECDELFEADCGECAELQVECAFGDEEACKEYGAVCEVECGTTVDNFNCCDVNNNLIISPLDDHDVYISGPENVKACFVDQIDGQIALEGEDGNAEQAVGAKDEEGNSYTIDKNRYCLVSCKEDYKMTMPTAKLVNAGRYFTFKAAVEGTKTCYTNTIDRELYNKDIIAKEKAITEAYNEYRKWYELYHNGNIVPVSGSYTSSCSCGAHNCGPNCSSTSYYPNWRATATVDDWQTVTGENEATGLISVRSGANGVSATYTYQRPIGAHSSSCSGGSWTVSVCTGRDENGKCTSHGREERSCPGGTRTYYTGTEVVHTEADFRNYLRSQMVSAQGRLEEAQKDYEDVIRQYNECSEWDSEIQYDPEVYYDYEESYLNDLGYNKGEMDKIISNVSNSEWYCNSNVTSSGNETKAELTGLEYDSCSLRNSSSQRYTTINYYYCDINGCGTNRPGSARKISDARYKKVMSSIDAEYIPSTLFYNIYPSGEITNKKADNNVALENGLPVALNTKRGIYKYTVNMTNLGEYYDTGNVFENSKGGDTGRLIGGKGAVINRDEYGEFVDANGTVQYACSYLVNMGITDGDTVICDFDTECSGDDCIADCIGPNCDYECTGEDCIADCIGAGCIYDSDAGTSLIERVVSLSNLFPNGTNSYNWNRDFNPKAEETITEIQEAGNSVYDEDPILSVTITPSVARAIKQYNDKAESDGGYSNSTLACYALDGYEEIACYSSFIDGLVNGYIEYDGVNYINNIDVVNSRSLIMGHDYRIVGDNNTKYFTTWNGKISEEDMLGPSWK